MAKSIGASRLSKKRRDNLSYMSRYASPCLVTGGAGFLGSHLVDSLVSNNIVVKVLDNLSCGSISNISRHLDNKSLGFVNSDISNLEVLNSTMRDTCTVYHLAANPEVFSGFRDPEVAFNQNIRNTFYLLEAVRRSRTVDRLAFTSSSAVYGEPSVIPTPENYGVLLPISQYGASKLACEALISSYSHNYGLKGLILRLVNIVGPRNKHGVLRDFMNKLNRDNRKLEILGDGFQSKSYLHVNDFVESVFMSFPEICRKGSTIEVFNIGNEDKIDVLSIARTVCRSMNLKETQLRATGGIENGRGWAGDVKNMQLDISRIKKIGWAPTLSSLEAITLSCSQILKEMTGLGSV